jgi:DNA-binding response OmpR family regulator
MSKERSSLRILIIEHDKDMLDLLEDEMRDIGHDVTKVCRYSSAILEASENHFDLIIAEVASPGLTGPEILACLRRLQPDALIAAMASFGTEQTAREAFEEGADYYIAKPIQMESLKDLIRHFAKDKIRFQRRGSY